MDSVKPCSRCREIKPLEQFNGDSRRRDGRTSACKECVRQAVRPNGKRRGSGLAKDGIKLCHRCQRGLPVTDFDVDARKKDGRVATCKKCRREAYYVPHPRYPDDAAFKAAWERSQERARDASRRSRRKRKEADIVGYFRDGYLSRCVRHGGEALEILPKEIRKILRAPCVACGASGPQAQIDHIIPVSRGGRHSVGNLQSLCKSCNVSKGSKLMSEWRYGKASRMRESVGNAREVHENGLH